MAENRYLPKKKIIPSCLKDILTIGTIAGSGVALFSVARDKGLKGRLSLLLLGLGVSPIKGLNKVGIGVATISGFFLLNDALSRIEDYLRRL